MATVTGVGLFNRGPAGGLIRVFRLKTAVWGKREPAGWLFVWVVGRVNKGAMGCASWVFGAEMAVWRAGEGE